MALLQVLSPDLLTRRVLFAVELVDPITQAFVSRSIRVFAAGLQGRPIVSGSGRFVWLIEGDAWPGTISITPERLPFASHVEAAPVRPLDVTAATAAQRLVRVTLRPSIAYPFDDGLTVIRGVVREGPSSSSPAVVGARVQLAWADDNGQWRPLPPDAEDVDETAVDAPSPREQETDAHGEFAAFVHLQPPAGVQADVDEARLLKVRLQVTRGRSSPITRVTPDDFVFLPEGDDPDEARRGRVPEGRVLAGDVALSWSGLIPV